jgi:hypothetical protein
MTLPTFLTTLAGRPFRWGRTDCCLVLADWLLASGRNRDVAEHLRGTYHDEVGCGAVLSAGGGVLRIGRRLADEACLERIDPRDAGPGAIAVVRHGRDGEAARHYGAIRTPSGRWAIKATDGLLMIRNPRVAAAWRVI